MTDLRCQNWIMFGSVKDGILEVKCKSRYCGAQDGAVVLHRFDTSSGELIGTSIYKNPRKEKA